jgi:hypothetical protein
LFSLGSFFQLRFQLLNFPRHGQAMLYRVASEEIISTAARNLDMLDCPDSDPSESVC